MLDSPNDPSKVMTFAAMVKIGNLIYVVNTEDLARDEPMDLGI